MKPKSAEIRTKPTLLFSLSRWMIWNNIRGGYRLSEFLLSLGLLNYTVRYILDGIIQPIALYVPIYRPESTGSKREIERYEHKPIDMIIEARNHHNAPVHIIDCGADIGMVSTSLARNCKNIAKLDAFEPNSEAYFWLEKTISELPFSATAHTQAVGNWNGRASLIQPADSDSAHAAFIEKNTNGDIEVTRIDDILDQDGHGIILKIDVEGGELAVIEGAEKLLAAAPFFIILVEAHFDVAERTGQDPCVILRKIREISDAQFRVAELPDVTINPDVNFFDQVPKNAGIDGKDILNVICISK